MSADIHHVLAFWSRTSSLYPNVVCDLNRQNELILDQPSHWEIWCMAAIKTGMAVLLQTWIKKYKGCLACTNSVQLIWLYIKKKCKICSVLRLLMTEEVSVAAHIHIHALSAGLIQLDLDCQTSNSWIWRLSFSFCPKYLHILGFKML